MFFRLVNLESYVGSCFLEIGDLGALSLKGCKAFLRKHGLRLSGTKMVCIQRIKEHWGKCGSTLHMNCYYSFMLFSTGIIILLSIVR